MSGSGDHSRLKSKVPVRPVRSNTWRSTPVNGFFRNPAIRSMVTLLPPMRPLSGELAEICPSVPQEIEGSCSPLFGEGSVGFKVGAVPAVCFIEDSAHALSSVLALSCGPICPSLTSTRLNAGFVRLSICTFNLNRSASSTDRIAISRISSFVGLVGNSARGNVAKHDCLIVLIPSRQVKQLSF